jgi:hypothetical protein
MEELPPALSGLVKSLNKVGLIYENDRPITVPQISWVLQQWQNGWRELLVNLRGMPLGHEYLVIFTVPTARPIFVSPTNAES